MKKFLISFIISIVVLMIVLVSPVPLAAEESAADKGKEDSVFQKMSDLINGKYEVKAVPYKKIEVFQKMADGICSISRQ